MRKQYILFILLAVCMAGVAGTAAGYALYRLRIGVPDTTEPPVVETDADTRYNDNEKTTADNRHAPSDAADDNTGILPILTPKPPDDTAFADLPEDAEETQATLPAHRYVLSLLDGYVAVFSASKDENDFDTVMEVTKTPATALSTDEQRRLSAGIKIFNDDQLAKILQDYGS